MKSIVGFGAGIDGHTFIAMAEGKVQIEYFLDNVHRGKIEAYDIYAPSKETCQGKYIVVTTTDHYNDIKKQLEGYGLSEQVDFVSVVEFLVIHKAMLKEEGKEPQLFLRDKKASLFKMHYMREFPEKTDLAHEVYRNAVILPLKRFPEDKLSMGRGGVVDEAGNYVSLSGMERAIFGKYEYKASLYRDEKVVYCGYLINQWGHFLMEAVARLWYFFKNDVSVDQYVFFIQSGLENMTLKGNYKEFFRLLGVLDKIEIINEPVRYREVIVPQLSYSLYHHYYSRQYKEIFAKVIENAMEGCEEQCDYGKVYFSRSHWNKSEFGQDMLDDFYEKNGFQIIYPEKLTLTQTISILQSVHTFAAVSGSAAHNILFGRDGQDVILMERCALNNVYQIDINKIKKLNASYIDANLSFLPVSYAGGPFIYYWNERFENYAKEKNWRLPSPRFKDSNYVCGNLKKYLDLFHRNTELNQFQYELFEEAYEESMQDIKNEKSNAVFPAVMDEIIRIREHLGC